MGVELQECVFYLWFIHEQERVQVSSFHMSWLDKSSVRVKCMIHNRTDCH